MNEQVKEIARRIVELREILEVSQEVLAEKVGVPVVQYAAYENGEADIPIGVIYGVAAELGVDPTVLLTGHTPRMKDYTIVRQGQGVKIERYAGYDFTSLAFNYIDRDFDPMIVHLQPSEHPPELVTHKGQEFNYVLEGKMQLVIGSRTFLLEAGDSVYFNPERSHGQRAVEGTVKFLTVINE